MGNTKPTVRLSFFGAAKTVTGSKFFLEVEKKKILIDCGLFQGRKELRQRNWGAAPFDPTALDAVILTHAHIDHSGYLPLIVRRGYRGPIYCTPATAELLKLLLPDSAQLQEEQARYQKKHATSKHKPPKPLYTEEDARQTLKQLKTIPRDHPTKLFSKCSVTPSCAGHILGSTCLTFDIHGKILCFSGDIGRFNSPILPDPQPLFHGDLLVCESTYGDRVHASANVEDELCAAVHKAQARKGALLIPAFAVGRTQNLLYSLGVLERAGRIPVLPVYVDSPMAVDATRIYRSFRHDYDEESSALIAEGKTPLLTENTVFCRARKESKRLNGMKGARIIISASGMVTGGRILHHMTHLLPEEENTVLFVGYQAEGTRGRIIQSGSDEIRMFGRHVPIRAKVHTISGLSAHGDRDELLRWLKSCSSSPGRVKIVHGEEDSTIAFSNLLKEEMKWDATPAEYNEQIEI